MAGAEEGPCPSLGLAPQKLALTDECGHPLAWTDV
jgi:hypothetical protein